MTPWRPRETFDALVVGRRLGFVLVAVAAYCVVAGLIARRLGLPALEVGSAGALVNTIILGLLMGFRNRAAYDRWWEARSLWGQLINDSRNLAAKCAAYVPSELVNRSGLAAVLIAFPEALKRRLRDESSEPGHVPLELAGRVFAILAGWKRDGHLDGPTQWVLDAHARGLMDVCGGCEKIRTTPLSPSLKGLLRAGLVLNVLAEPWLTVPEIGFWGLPVFLLVCFFLFGVELIDTILEEPFGRERDELDLDRFCRVIREGVEQCLPAATHRPESSKAMERG
jgi:putative membrane protein